MPVYPPMPRWSPGDELTSDQLNQIARGADRALNLTVAPGSGLQIADVGKGKLITRREPEPIWGVLSGSSSPYTFTESVEGSTGSWSAAVRTGTAYEVNNVASLGGKRVRLYPDRHSNWRFQMPTSSLGTTLNLTMRDGPYGASTYFAVPGLAVTLTMGAYSSTVTTNGSGVATFTGVPALTTGTFTAPVPTGASSGRYLAISSPYTSGSAGSTTNANYNIPIASGYFRHSHLAQLFGAVSTTLSGAWSGFTWSIGTGSHNMTVAAANSFPSSNWVGFGGGSLNGEYWGYDDGTYYYMFGWCTGTSGSYSPPGFMFQALNHTPFALGAIAGSLTTSGIPWVIQGPGTSPTNPGGYFTASDVTIP